MRRYIFLLPILLLACISPFDPEIIQNQPKVVVDGMITDSDGPYRLLLRYSTPYNNAPNSVISFITNATVSILDSEGTVTALRHIGSGTYETPAEMRGVPGRSYSLAVVLEDGKEYKSFPEQMVQVPEIDTVYGEYNRLSGGSLRGEFSMFLHVTDPGTESNYYAWQWEHYTLEKYCQLAPDSRNGTVSAINCCDPCWSIQRCNGCINVFSDELVNGNTIARVPITKIPYDSKDPYFIVVTQRSLTGRAYRFWRDVANLVENSGGIFDRPPSTIVGNIFNVDDSSEQVLGFFEVTSVKTKSIYFARNHIAERPFGDEVLYSEVPGVCLPCSTTGGLRTTTAPPGW